MPSGANVAAGAGFAQPGEAAPLPHSSLPIADTLSLVHLSSYRPHERDSRQVEEEQHSEADEPLLDGVPSDDHRG